MKKSMCFVAIALGVLSLSFTGCKSDNNPVTTPDKALAIVYPKGGESLKANQTITIQWQVNDKTKIGSVQIDFSKDNGKTYNALAGHSFPTDTTSYSWTIDNNINSDSCIMKVKEYNTPSINDKSAKFSIRQQ